MVRGVSIYGITMHPTSPELRFGSGALITGSLLENYMMCDMRALLSYERSLEAPVRPVQGKARRIAGILMSLSLQEGRYRLVRRKYIGEVGGVAAVVTPDATIFEGDRIVGFARFKVRENMRVYPSDYAPLMLAALLAGLETGGVLLTVAVSRTIEKLGDAVRYLAVNGPTPNAGTNIIVSTRVYSREETLRAVERLVSIITGRLRPRGRPGSPACNYCPYRAQCPLVNS